MKKLLAIIFMLFSALSFTQNYKEKLGKEVCLCMNEFSLEGQSQTQLEQSLGLCFIKSAMPYSKEIYKDYGIDLNTDIGENSKMEKLGEKLGIIVLTQCPDLFSKFISRENNNDNAAKEENYRLINGTISKIEKDNFIVFHLVGENKILNKFYWISTIESDIDMPKDYNSILNKKVTISYYTTEIFDAKISDYRNLNIVSSLKLD